MAIQCAPGTDTSLSDARILIVDDNQDIITLTQRILVQQNYEILTAADGTTGLHLAQTEKPDLVLLDVMLPGMDGLEVCRRIKGDPETRKLMVLLITGCGSLDHRVKGLESGADDYITKPFHLTELLARVRSALRIKKLTDEIEESHRALLEAQKERLRSEKMATIGLLATGIAHEFNNIMSGISGFAQLAKKNGKYKDQLVEVTLIQAERAMNIANSLSTFYRPSKGCKPTDVQTVIENAICLVTKQIKENEIEIVRNFKDVPQVLIHPGEVQEVVLNLSINAIHAIGKKGKIEIGLDQIDEMVRITISDTGCGMSPEVADRIFDPFFTTKGALGGGSSSGSGLGLSVSYNIVKSHHGQLSVKSEEGVGTTFTIDLPIHHTDSISDLESEEAAGELDVNVVLADPDGAVQELVVNYLRDVGLTCCSNWEETLEALESGVVNSLVLDTELPGDERTFAEVFDWLLETWPDLRIVVTSSNLSDDLQSCLPRAHGHLLKPYTVENLTNTLSLV